MHTTLTGALRTPIGRQSLRVDWCHRCAPRSQQVPEMPLAPTDLAEGLWNSDFNSTTRQRFHLHSATQLLPDSGIFLNSGCDPVFWPRYDLHVSLASASNCREKKQCQLLVSNTVRSASLKCQTFINRLSTCSLS